MNYSISGMFYLLMVSCFAMPWYHDMVIYTSWYPLLMIYDKMFYVTCSHADSAELCDLFWLYTILVSWENFVHSWLIYIYISHLAVSKFLVQQGMLFFFSLTIHIIWYVLSSQCWHVLSSMFLPCSKCTSKKTDIPKRCSNVLSFTAQLYIIYV